MMKKLWIFLIIAGIVTALYPLIDRAYTWYWQQRIYSEWHDSVYLKDIIINPEDAFLQHSESNHESEHEISRGYEQENIDSVIGILTIEKINLKLPLLKGTSLANLKIGAGLLENYAGIGEIGNAPVLAHRSYTFGRFFNRLDELEEGDEIIVSTRDYNFRYTVYRKVIVEIDDYSIFEGNNEDRVLTLVTCHPVHNSDRHLVVQAVM